MDGSTRCPHCDTRFKIAAAQLQAHQGQVRCGQCLTPFDASNEFIADDPHPQLEIPALFDEPATPVDAPQASADDNSLDFSQTAPPYLASPSIAVAVDSYEHVAEPLYTHKQPTLTRVLSGLFLVLLLALLMAQFIYHYRADLSARLPASQAALQAACKWLACTISLPQNSELISIESSNLETDPSNSQLIMLSVLLRNHANYVLALPNLELTLNDAQERPLSRRVFQPSEYLLAGQKNSAGLPANQELDIKLWLQLDNLNPSGYRLVLLYNNS